MPEAPLVPYMLRGSGKGVVGRVVSVRLNTEGATGDVSDRSGVVLGGVLPVDGGSERSVRMLEVALLNLFSSARREVLSIDQSWG